MRCVNIYLAGLLWELTELNRQLTPKQQGFDWTGLCIQTFFSVSHATWSSGWVEDAELQIRINNYKTWTCKYFIQFFLKNLLEYSWYIMLASAVDQSESVIYIHTTYTYIFFLRFFSHIHYCRVLSRVHCAI